MDADWSPWRQRQGAWVFDVVLPVDGGAAVVAPRAVTDIAGVPVKLSSVVVGSSAIRIALEIDDPLDGEGWSMIGRVRRAAEVFPVVLSTMSRDGELELQTGDGVSDASGDWPLEITEVIQSGADGEDEARGCPPSG